MNSYSNGKCWCFILWQKNSENLLSSSEQSILGEDLGETERAVEIERIPDGEHSFTFCSQIVTSKMNKFYIFIG